MCPEKKKEDDSPALKIVHRYNDSKIILKKKQRKTDYHDRKLHKQHKDQQNNNN